jgi:hypothetical protein
VTKGIKASERDSTKAGLLLALAESVNGNGTTTTSNGS